MIAIRSNVDLHKITQNDIVRLDISNRQDNPHELKAQTEEIIFTIMVIKVYLRILKIFSKIVCEDF